MNIAEHVARIARERPHHPALIFEGQSLSYATLEQCASALADAMARAGVKTGDRIALYLPNIPAFALAYLASLRLGAIAVSINAMLKAEEVAFILKDTTPRIVFTTAELAPNVSPLQCPSVRHLITCEGGSAIADPLEEWLERGSPLRPIQPMDPDAPALILHTTGTTGFPKSVTLSHFNVISNTRTSARSSGYRSSDRLVCYLPLCQAFAQNHLMNACFEAGATLVLLRRFSPDAIVQALRRTRATMFFGVPTAYVTLLNADLRPEALSGIRYFFSAAASLPQDIARQWIQRFGQPIHQGYGLTECSPLAAYHDASPHKPGSVGRAVEGFDIRILDEEGQEVERGAWGEICIRGPGVMLGYWRKAQETEQVLRGGWLHSGDIGVMDDDGYVSIIGPIKDMIDVAGVKVWPTEVESLLYHHPAVREVAVYGEPHPETGERVSAAVVLRAGWRLDSEALIGFCRDRLAACKAPHRVEFVATLPRSATGKVLKRLLRARAQLRQAQASSDRPTAGLPSGLRS